MIFNKLRKEIKDLKQEISFLRNEILNIKNPYEFKIGNYVECKTENLSIKGVIVGMSSGIRDVTNTNVEPGKGICYKFDDYRLGIKRRVNEYKVYNHIDKITHICNDIYYEIKSTKNDEQNTI
jgi:hypothetical protein